MYNETVQVRKDKTAMLYSKITTCHMNYQGKPIARIY